MGLERNERVGHSAVDNIAVVPFKKQKHLKYLKEMLVSQNYPESNDMDTYNLPKIGYIAFYDKVPIATGFLRKVEGNVIAQIDGLASNPYLGGIIRHNALSQILDRIIYDAKALKLKGLICFCEDYSTIKRAEDIGFTVVSHTTLSLSL